MEQNKDSFIYDAFTQEGLKVIDNKQIEELKRWYLLDFEEFNEYKHDHYISNEKIISICGSGRSGTTLTRVMLDSHPDIYSGPESLLLLPVTVDINNLSLKFDIAENKLLELYNKSSSRSEFIDNFKSLLLDINGKKIWADKTVRNIHCIPYFYEHFPNGKIINVVRDPRDTIASLRTHKKRKIENGEIKDTGYIMPLTLCIDRWNNSIESVLPYRGDKNYLEIKYESLILDTEKSLRKVCEFCEIEFNKKMLNFHEISGTTRKYTNFIQNIEATKPLSKNSIDRYKFIFDQQQIKFIEEKTLHHAKIIGYTF